MFNDEESFAFKKMHEYSPVDGFMEITECLAEMIKFAANEPSAGLFYIQQHTQNAAPNLIILRNKVVEKSHEMTLQTEDTDDSIITARSMKECGFSIADEMIGDIKNSLSVMSTKQPKRGLINSSSWSPAMWNRNIGYRLQDIESSSGSSGYFSNVFRSAKRKASSFKWPQLESTELNQVKGETVLYPDSRSSVAATSNSSSMPEAEGEELPLSSPIAYDPQEVPDDGSLSHHELLSLSESYQEFKADREAKLEEWLAGVDDENPHEARSKERQAVF